MIRYIFFIFFTTAFCSAQSIRNFSNEFLNIGVDASAFAMGKSTVALSNDTNSAYWNPAGLTKINDYQGSIMHAEYFSGIAKYDYASFSIPIDSTSVLAIHAIRFGVDDILNTTNLISEGVIDYNRISLFSATDWAFNVAFAKEVNISDTKLSIGANSKVLRRKIGDFASSIGFGFDAGLQYKSKKWLYGLTIRDITTTFNAWSFNDAELDKIITIYNDINQSKLNDNDPTNDNELIPTSTPEKLEITKPKIQAGIARKFTLHKNFSLATEIDLNFRFTKTNDIIASSFTSITPSFGFQLDYNNYVYLRGGVNNFQNQTDFDNTKYLTLEPSFGVGFSYKGISIDYALSNIGNANGFLFSNIFSVKIDYSKLR